MVLILSRIRSRLGAVPISSRIILFFVVSLATTYLLTEALSGLPSDLMRLFMIGMFAVVLLGLFLYLRRLLVGPAHHLVEAIGRVADGDLTSNRDLNLPGELGRVHDSIGRMAETLDNRLQRLATLCEVSREMTSTLDLQVVLDLILRRAVEVQGADGGSIMLLDEEGRELTIEAAINLDGRVVRSARVKLGEGISGWVAKNGQPLFLDRDVRDPRFSGTRDVETAMSVPIMLRGEVAGVLNVSTEKAGKRRSSPSRLKEEDIDFLMTLANQVSPVIRNARLYQNLRASYFSTIEALTAAIDAKDPYTHGHSARVAEYAGMIAERMSMAQDRIEMVRTAAYLHDVGKIGIPEAILSKPGKLTDEEFEIIKTHPEISARILSPAKFQDDFVGVVRHHHESYDGRGYPAGLGGTAIPLEARVLTVADSFDAMTSIRPYRPPLSVEGAREELRRCCGTQFDPDVVEIFDAMIQSGRVGMPSTDPVDGDVSQIHHNLSSSG